MRDIRIVLASFAVLLFVSAISAHAQSPAPEKRVLVVGTNTSTFNNQTNGTFLMEIAPPIVQFSKSGYKVDVVTPLGGKAAVYHNGDMSADLKAQANDPVFLDRTANSLKPSDVDIRKYAAVFVPGGYAQFLDVMNDKALLGLIGLASENGAVIGVSGHGAATLSKVMLSNGNHLVKGKTLTSFPTWFEHKSMAVSDYGKKLPFDMEQELIKGGANFKPCTDEAKQNCFVVDRENRLVSGARAFQAGDVAKEMLTLLQ